MKLSFGRSDSENKSGKLEILKIKMWVVGHPGDVQNYSLNSLMFTVCVLHSGLDCSVN